MSTKAGAFLIEGLGLATPSQAIGQGDAAQFARGRSAHTPDQVARLAAVYRRTTVRRRGSVLIDWSPAERDNGQVRDEAAVGPSAADAESSLTGHGPNAHEQVRGIHPEPASEYDANAEAGDVNSPGVSSNHETGAPTPSASESLSNGHAEAVADASVRRRADDWGQANEQGRADPFGGFYPLAAGSEVSGPSVDRRMRGYADQALPLGKRAAVEALDRAGVGPRQIGQLVVVSCTGFDAPGLDVRLIDALGLEPTVGRTVVGFMGCHGAINGLRAAQGLALTQPGGFVLMCCVELCTLHFQYGWDMQRVVANALFADGAAAMVGRAADHSGQSQAVGRTSDREASAVGDRDAAAIAEPKGSLVGESEPTLRGPRTGVNAGQAGGGQIVLLKTASMLLPDSLDAMTWRIGQHGFEMTLSSAVPDLVETHLGAWIVPWLAKQGLTPAQIAGWAIHPGGPKVITAVERALELDRSAGRFSRQVLAEHGNMSSPTVMFIVERMRQAGIKGPCVALAFGPGLMAEAALLELG